MVLMVINYHLEQLYYVGFFTEGYGEGRRGSSSPDGLPHWMFDRYPLKFLHDPKGTYGNVESIYVVGWKGFTEKDPLRQSFSAILNSLQKRLVR